MVWRHKSDIAMQLFTLGHSNHPFDKLVHLLKANDVQCLVDVRSLPASRFNPQFNRKNLEQQLPTHQIQYVFSGKSLGGRPTDPACYNDPASPKSGVNYTLVMQRPWFQEGIQQLLALSAQQPTAIMCSEEDPAKCHRHHLIAAYLLQNQPQLQITHIRGNGTLLNAKALLLPDPDSSQQSSLFNA